MIVLGSEEFILGQRTGRLGEMCHSELRNEEEMV
jgi:hypothetical protein